MYDLVIEDATLVSGQGRTVADLGIRKGKIAFVGARAGRATQRISAIGKFIMPGIVDMGVRLNAPGLDPAETWEKETRAAVSSGVTTLIEMPDTLPLTQSTKSLSTKRKIAKLHSRANFGFWVQATKKNIDKLPTMLEKGAVGVCIDMGAQGIAQLDDETILALFGSIQGVVSLLAEDASMLKRAKLALGDGPVTPNGARPPRAATHAVERLLNLVRRAPRAVHLMGLSTAAELHLLDPLRGDLPISVGTSPNHLFLNADNEAQFKLQPPLREELDRRSLWTALKRQRVDAVSSLHSPYTQAELAGPNYWDSPWGLPGVETSFPLMMAAVHHGRAGLERMVELLSEGPARILGLPRKGVIKRGNDADLLLFSEGQLERWQESQILGRSGWSPYTGRELAGKPELVIVGGEIVAKRGEILNDSVRGTEVTATRRRR